MGQRRSNVNLKEIKEMLKLMEENNLMELEIEKEGLRIRLKKSSASDGQSIPVIIEKETKQKPQSDSSREQASAVSINTVEIKAPMVGTFYRAPGPEAPPYIEVGQRIEPGQVICVIEAMKLMNEIKSEIKGKITEILTENADPVEFGQPLFLVESF
ncbi:MAG: acetyl-CoA carboxylase biotin carboxyl carrier protein [Candidatus Omnitrophica bacterium]|nr:acetyl-CoA carboxylase biotin carboxyl carrier protein [Candidatus Omnitrophota bacterium]MBU1871675.1 acetyl-CoA carboxylase biotin carboxyl carrier protein [Candidatus Omnitrophota bacterium]